MSSKVKNNLFISHNWGEDENGRDNHQRVVYITELLCKKGYKVWLDQNEMTGDINRRMMEGIEGADVVIVFVTVKYMKKVNGDMAGRIDNAQREFEYAVDTKKKEKIVCVVLDSAMTNPGNWKGNLKFSLPHILFVDMSGDLADRVYLTRQLDEMERNLMMKNVKPSEVQKICHLCDVITDGAFCTKCGKWLQLNGKVKNYCAGCNVHVNGRFCAQCGRLVEEEEAEEKLFCHACNRSGIGNYCSHCGKPLEKKSTADWVEVFSQTNATREFKDKVTLENCKLGSGTDFIDFEKIKHLPEYHFKLVWNEGKVPVRDYALEWKQKENPLSVKDQDMQPTDAKLVPSDRVPEGFVGLSLSQTSNTFLDGMGGNTQWWYSVGNTIEHDGGNPAYYQFGGYPQLVASRTQLFVKKHGEWVEIFSQTKHTNQFKDKCTMENCKFGSDKDFINFEHLNEIDDDFHFKLVWDEGKVKPVDYALEWKQSSNPLTSTDSNMSPKDAKLIPSGSIPSKFYGLSLSRTDRCLIDGQGGLDWWWYTVGATVDHQGGIPGYLLGVKGDGVTGFVAKQTQLYVKMSTSIEETETALDQVYGI